MNKPSALLLVVDASPEAFMRIAERMGADWRPVWVPALSGHHWWLQLCTMNVGAVVMRVERLDAALEAKFAQLRAMLGARLLALVAAPPSASERARFEALGIEVLLDDAKPTLGASTSPHFCASACM